LNSGGRSREGGKNEGGESEDAGELHIE
jgi:hypothetical protein